MVAAQECALARISPPIKQWVTTKAIPFFFTNEHRDYWLKMADS
jgi:hypothetical protein